MTHIRDLQGLPEVGRFYRVPCVRTQPTSSSRKALWLPVIGPEHTDPEISFDERHWHYDARFLSPSLCKILFGWQEPGNRAMVYVRASRAVEAGPVERPRKCHRQMPEFPHETRPGVHVAWQRDVLEPKYAGCRINPQTPVCPHKGIPLCGLPVDADGCVVCPGHGLKWDLATGELIPRCAPHQTLRQSPRAEALLVELGAKP